jgi:hypothetical protein
LETTQLQLHVAHLLTRFGLDGSGFEPRWGKILPSPLPFRETLETTQLQLHVAHLLTRFGLDGSGFEPRWGKNFTFSTPVQRNLGDHSASCTMDSGPFSLGESDRYVALIIHRPSYFEIKNM